MLLSSALVAYIIRWRVAHLLRDLGLLVRRERCELVKLRADQDGDRRLLGTKQDISGRRWIERS